MKNYKLLEEKPAPISEDELEKAKAAFFASGGTIQRRQECPAKSRKTKKIISKYFRT